MPSHNDFTSSDKIGMKEAEENYWSQLVPAVKVTCLKLRSLLKLPNIFGRVVPISSILIQYPRVTV